MTQKKHLGQHFLHDTFIVEKIVDAINPKNTDHIVEIGPGHGALTQAVLPHLNKIDVIEFDKDVIDTLKSNCEPLGTLNIHLIDALKFELSSLNKSPIRVIGNLPYNISTPLIFHLLKSISLIKDMHFMLQKEVVDRMCASPNSKTYGRLSVMVQLYCDTEKLFKVKPGAFTPPPKVDSAVVRLIPTTERLNKVKDLNRFEQIVAQAFSQRRKTIQNALQTLIPKSDWANIPLNPMLRPEQLSLDDFIQLSIHVNIKP